jgi:hypothetical protein
VSDRISGTSGSNRRFPGMQYRGSQYQVEESIEPLGWKWTVLHGDLTEQSGYTLMRAVAALAAMKAIDIHISRTKRVTLEPK